MSDTPQPTIPNNDHKTFYVQEFGVSVLARTLEEAVSKAKKASKEKK